MKKIKKPKSKHYVYVLVSLLVIGAYASVLLLWRHQNSLQNEINQVVANQAASDGSSYNDVTISPIDKTVYLPLAKLKLPDTTLNEGLVYTYTEPYTIKGINKTFPAKLEISTHDLIANAPSTAQFNCMGVAYADFVTPSYPINPMYQSDGSIKLANGKTMNVYYAPSIPGCDGAWQQLNKIDSKAIADALKEAVSY